MDGLRQVMELNLWGTLLPTQYFGKEIARNGTGSIVNISSMHLSGLSPKYWLHARQKRP
jgi:NAD(P)-dependent dehydrogenase (short-subunit alcohol dehydrogenase family)